MSSQQDLLLARLPLHGGDVISAAKQYSIPAEQWVDLSTGMNPTPYPIPTIPSRVFYDLPYRQAEFTHAVKQYYQQDSFLAVSGTQSAIQVLPSIVSTDRHFPVLLPKVGYQEHQKQWREYGVEVNSYESECPQALLDDIQTQLDLNPRQHLVLINPNNPTTVQVQKTQILAWSSMLAEEAYLIVDEAFIDVEPESSLLHEAKLPSNIIVLRSFGKFFGLAGLRLGFVFAAKNIIKSLQNKLGIWQVNGPAQYIAGLALKDTSWQQQARLKLIVNARATQELFTPLLSVVQTQQPVRKPFFTSYFLSLSSAIHLYSKLAEQGVLTRVVVLDDRRALLRIASLDVDNSNAKTQVTSAVNHLLENQYAPDVVGER